MVIVTNERIRSYRYMLSLENYKKSVCKFLKGKKQAILNGKDSLLMECADCAYNTFLFDLNHRELKLFGVYNQENASGAFKAAELLGIYPKFINKVLSSFNNVEGRTISINFTNSRIIIGKTNDFEILLLLFLMKLKWML